jgi:hypothetical protein
MNLIYCDHIAHVVRQALQQRRGSETYVQYVGPVQFDLDSNGGLRSTTKQIQVSDANDTQYVITIETKADLQQKISQQHILERELSMLRHELISCETELQNERTLRAKS